PVVITYFVGYLLLNYLVFLSGCFFFPSRRRRTISSRDWISDVCYSDLVGLGGAEANENAVRAARAVTGRHKIVSRYRSYHGATRSEERRVEQERSAQHMLELYKKKEERHSTY